MDGLELIGNGSLHAVSSAYDLQWDDSGWFLVGDSVFKMEGFDDMRGHDTWTYDSHSKKYRSTWVDNMGSTGTGTATHNEKTNTWTMKATSHTPRQDDNEGVGKEHRRRHDGVVLDRVRDGRTRKDHGDVRNEQTQVNRRREQGSAYDCRLRKCEHNCFI